MHLFERTVGGKYRAPVSVGGCMIRRCAAGWTTRLSQDRRGTGNARTAGREFDDAAVLAGKTTPVFSAAASTISACSFCSTVF
jgi:hypothetical protein